jgi:hypothetical protein
LLDDGFGLKEGRKEGRNVRGRQEGKTWRRREKTRKDEGQF